MQFYVLMWFFLVTLDSFYFYEINVALPPVLAGIMSFFLLPFIFGKIAKTELLKLKYLLILFCYVIFFGLLNSFSSNNLYYSRFLALFLFSSVALTTLYFSANYGELFYNSIVKVLCLHLIAFYLQVASHYFGFGYIDYLYFFTGESQRAFGGSYNSDFFGAAGFIRPTGLFNEPGTYATVIFLIFLFAQSYGALQCKINNQWLTFFTLFSVFLSFSVFGMIFLLLYFVYLVRKNIYYMVPIIIFSLILIPIVYDVYIYPRFFSGAYTEDGIGFRFSAIYDYTEFVINNFWTFFFGFGFFTDFSSLFESYVWADLGLLLYSIVVFGFIGNFLLIATLFGKYSFVNQVFILSMIILLSKLPITSMFFWFAISGVAYLANSRRIKIY